MGISSRAARLSASILLSLVMAVGLGSTVLGASPIDPTPTPSVTTTPKPVVAPGARPATDTRTRSQQDGCSPVGWNPSWPRPDCPTRRGVPAATESNGAAPSATTGCPGVCYSVKGTLTGTGGTPLSGIEVDVYSNDYGDWTLTAGDGTWSVAVPAGTYTVSFWNPPAPYLSGYFSFGSSGNFSYDYTLATAVPVVAADVTGINVQLAVGHYIEGLVTAPGGSPLSDVEVDPESSIRFYAGAWTAADGTYSVLVPSSAYTMYYTDPTGTYLNGYYSSGSSGGFSLLASSATPVTVGSSDVTGINVQLGQAAGHIKGKVTSSDGTPIQGIQVGSWSADYSGSGATGSDGTYSMAVPAGSYLVEFWSYVICGPDYCTTPYLSGYYSSSGFVLDSSQATLVSVTSSDVTGIDVVMTPSGATYHAVTPTRVLDTRNGTGGLSGPFTNHAARTFQVTGGVVPSGATAVTGNLTVTGQTSNGYLFMGPVATNNPGSSTLNFPTGDDRANAVTVALGAGGTLSITFVGPSNGQSAQAIFDVTGYFTPDTSGATYHAIAPTRVLDTRSGKGGLSGPFTNHSARTFTVTGGSTGVPTNAAAVTGNLTVTGQTSSGYLFIGPVAANDPSSSTLNFPSGDDRANAVTVALGAGGTLSITFVAPSNGPTAQAIFDVTGYFTPDTTGAGYVPLTPQRVLDTRNGTGGLSGPFGSHYARSFGVSGSAGVPSYAVAVTGNLTVTGQTSLGYLYIGPTEKNDPSSSTLNFPVGDDRANGVDVALGSDGSLSITFVAPAPGATANAIFDVTGYFIPAVVYG